MNAVDKTMLGTAGAVLLLTSVILLPGPSERTPEQDHASEEQITEQRTIDYCWQQQSRKSLSADVAQFIAGACEVGERKYFQQYGRWYTRNGVRQ